MPYRNWHAVLADERYAPSSQMIRDYLTLTEGLESPTPYHIWSFISLFGALAGSRVYIDQGAIGKKKLNLGVILIGFPAIKKSSAITVMEQFSEGLPLQYGPTDTSGQRQGIMAAMLPRWQYDSMVQDKEEFDLEPTTLEILANFDTTGIIPAVPMARIPPASELYFASKELGQLLASPSRELMDFFTNTIDGVSINYQLKTQSIKIKSPLVNLLGATTPGSLYDLLPRGAPGHGFLSRLIFVYADRLANSNPIPRPWNDTQRHLRDRMLSQIEETFERVDGGLHMSDAAGRTYSDLYVYSTNMRDVRLSAYAARRPNHIMTMSGLIALMRGAHKNQIIASDVRLAHAIMTMTEGLMPKAFYGMERSQRGQVLIAATEYLERQPRFKIKDQVLIDQLMHLGTRNQIKDFLDELVTAEYLIHSADQVQLNQQDKELAELRPGGFYRAGLAADDYAPMRQRDQLHVVETQTDSA